MGYEVNRGDSEESMEIMLPILFLTSDGVQCPFLSVDFKHDSCEPTNRDNPNHTNTLST